MIREAATPILHLQEALAGSVARIETQRDEDLGALWSALVRVESERKREMAALRKDLETVAVYSEGFWTDARQNMIQLTAHAQPAGTP
jgi:hypothetical protein